MTVPSALPDAVRRRPRYYGALVVATGFLSLVALRFLASPVGRRILGVDRVGVVAFLGIPLFLGLLAAGILLFLLEPTEAPE